MSRAALWRQEGNVKERERRAEEIFETAVEEGRQKAARHTKGLLPLWGSDSSFHFNPMLLQNTIHSTYFQKCCEKLQDWNACIDEIYYEVKHLMPFVNNKQTSSAFCLLLRLLTLRMTEHQMTLTLKHPDSPYIRGIGFLYLRYTGTPERIWQWIEPYLYDEEEFAVEPGQRASTTMTMGEFVRDLFQSREFHGTPLPRFPAQVERSLQVRLLQAEQVANRAALHFKNQPRMTLFQTLGSEVMALYGDDENPITWYKAVVDRVITRDEEGGFAYKHPRFVVSFPEYGNTETVLLGEMDVLDGNWKHEDPSAPPVPPQKQRGGGGGYDRRGGGGGGRDLYEEVRRRERDTAASGNRGSWARRPPSTKNALSSQVRTVQDEYRSNHHHQQSRHQHQQQQRHPNPSSQGKGDNRNAQARQQQDAAPRKRSAEEMAAIQEKKRKLQAKYG